MSHSRASRAALGLAFALVVAGCGTIPPTEAPSATASGPAAPFSSAGPSSPGPGSPSPSASDSLLPRPLAELPRGGRAVFPRYRLVGYAGLTGVEALGRLGVGDLDDRVRELQRRARPYARGREVLPVLEIIATMVQADPGRDRRYRIRLSDDRLDEYLATARRHDALLLLNLQPGRSSFLAEAQAYEKYLRQPDVGLALDPEWAMRPGQVPGRVYGHTTGAELDEVSRYLARLVADHGLPEKVMVYHQVAASVVRRESRLRAHPGVAVVKSVDGIGARGPKETTYRVVNQTTPRFVHAGFKLFFVEDRRQGTLMTPQQVLALRPQPEYVMYE